MANLKSLTPFLFLFALPFERIFIKMHSIESRCFTGPENILFAGMSTHLSAREFLEAGAVKGLIMITLWSRITLSQMNVHFMLKLKQVTSKHAA